MITCTVSSGEAAFAANGARLQSGGVSQMKCGATDTLDLVVNTTGSFENIVIYCRKNIASHHTFFYLFIRYPSALKAPILTVQSSTNSEVVYHVDRADQKTCPLIAGYEFEVYHFGVPIIGEYVNAGRGRTVTISPAVPWRCSVQDYSMGTL